MIAASKENAASHACAMEELRTTVGRVTAAAALAEIEQDEAMKAVEARLQTTRIELVSLVFVSWVVLLTFLCVAHI